VGEARRAGMLGSEEAASLTDIPNIRQKGTRLGNWLTREQAKELLAVPDRSTLKGKRDYVILALLVGCALSRNELAELDVETIQQREGRWVLADLEGKGRRIRTVAIPIWVKQRIDVWMTAAGIEDGRLLRSVSKSGKINRDTLSDWAVWSVPDTEPSQHFELLRTFRSALACKDFTTNNSETLRQIILKATLCRSAQFQLFGLATRAGYGSLQQARLVQTFPSHPISFGPSLRRLGVICLCSFDSQSEQPARLLQVDVICSDCNWYRGGADLKRFK
jgi:hypothetical protein